MINNFALMGSSLGLLIIIILAILVFEIAMLIDVIRNKAITENSKILWVIGMLLIHPVVAIIYFFTDRQKGRR